MSEEKLRGLLREAREVARAVRNAGSLPYAQWTRDQHEANSLIERIDAALAEPVVGCTACEQFRKDFAERWYECHDGSEQACCKSHE